MNYISASIRGRLKNKSSSERAHQARSKYHLFAKVPLLEAEIKLNEYNNIITCFLNIDCRKDILYLLSDISASIRGRLSNKSSSERAHRDHSKELLCGSLALLEAEIWLTKYNNVILCLVNIDCRKHVIFIEWYLSFYKR